MGLERLMCPAAKCFELLPPGKVLCDRCWRRVPAELKDRLVDAHMRGRSTPDFKRALGDAVRALLQRSLLHD